jgi:hypothetical protein
VTIVVGWAGWERISLAADGRRPSGALMEIMVTGADAVNGRGSGRGPRKLS